MGGGLENSLALDLFEGAGEADLLLPREDCLDLGRALPFVGALESFAADLLALFSFVVGPALT